MLPALPVQRRRGHQRSLLIDAESVALVAVHDGEGERRAVVRRVAVGHGELENARARRSVLLQGAEAEGRGLMVRDLRWCDVIRGFYLSFFPSTYAGMLRFITNVDLTEEETSKSLC